MDARGKHHRLHTPPDLTAPTVLITAPAPGEVVHGTILVTGIALDNVGVAGVHVSLDAGPAVQAFGTNPWQHALDLSVAADGPHTITAVAIDTNGNVSAEATIQVIVDNDETGSRMLPEGVLLEVAAGTSWSLDRLETLLRTNAYQLDQFHQDQWTDAAGLKHTIGPALAVTVQSIYVSSTSTSAGSGGRPDGTSGIVTYRAHIYLNAAPGSTFLARPEYVMAHEYGHAWTLWHLYLEQQKDWSKWLDFRTDAGDPRLDTGYTWMRNEIIADDYRLLFGSLEAINEAAFIQPEMTDPRDVPGYREWLEEVWASR